MDEEATSAQKAPEEPPDFGAVVAKTAGAPPWVWRTVCVIFTTLIGACLFIYTEKKDIEAKVTTYKTGIDGDINKLKDSINTSKDQTDVKLKTIADAIRVLADKSPNKELANGILRDVNERITPLERRLNDIQAKVEQQASLVRVFNPDRILAVVRSEVTVAQTNKNYSISIQGLADLKNAVLTVPQTTPGYWYTAQLVVNYNSEALIASGAIPNPVKVAHPCPGLTSDGNMNASHNTYGAITFRNCIVDLDTEFYDGTRFISCLIRSRGGGFLLRNVQFVNCKFVLELPDEPKINTDKRFVEQLLLAGGLDRVTANNAYTRP